MTRLFFTSLFCLLLLSPLSAQTVSEGVYTFAKKDKANGLSLIVQGQVKNVTDVLETKFQNATGSKPKNFKGMTVFEGVRYPAVSMRTMDLYFGVDKASKNDDQNSRVDVFLSTGNMNFMDSRTYPDEIMAMKQVLSNLATEVKVHELNLVITDQIKLLDKETKTLERMVADSVSLESQRIEILKQIEQNKADRANQLELILNETATLQKFKAELRKTETGQTGEMKDEEDDK
jgi:hypothetical protein